MQLQRMDRRGAERLQIVRVDRAQVALGRHMQGNGLGHVQAEQLAQQGGAHHLMTCVAGGAPRVLERFEQMAVVVKQGGDDQALGGAVVRCESGALQGVLVLVDLLSVEAMAEALIVGQDLIEGQGGHAALPGWRRARVAIRPSISA